MSPGPAPRPSRRLRDAAIEYAAALEAQDDLPFGSDGTETDVRRTWDRLRKAALAYQDGPRVVGRPPALLVKP